MMKLFLTAVLALLGFSDLYCPECERFSADGWSVDARGLCRGCGRRPAVVEAGVRQWNWCQSSEEWREEPCFRDPSRGCCTPWTSTALARVPADATLGRHPFCPRCRVFRPFERARDGRELCGSCGRPPATVDTADLVWSWCRGDERWYLEPCDRDRASKCCVPRAVRMPLATSPWPPVQAR